MEALQCLLDRMTAFTVSEKLASVSGGVESLPALEDKIDVYSSQDPNRAISANFARYPKTDSSSQTLTEPW
jgi:hypothetical protein